MDDKFRETISSGKDEDIIPGTLVSVSHCEDIVDDECAPHNDVASIQLGDGDTFGLDVFSEIQDAVAYKALTPETMCPDIFIDADVNIGIIFLQHAPYDLQGVFSTRNTHVYEN